MKRYVFNYLDRLPHELNFPLHVQAFGFVEKNFHIPLKIKRDELIFSLILKNYGDTSNSLDEDGNAFPEKCFSILPPFEISSSARTVPWDELYISYPSSAVAIFTGMGMKITRLRKPIELNERLQRQINDLLSLYDFINRPGVADRIDVLAFQIITECLLPDDSDVLKDITHPAIFAIASYFRKHFTQKIELDFLLKRHGISQRSFYREWQRNFDMSPCQYLLDLRFSLAKELLRSSEKRMNEIAANCGFLSSMDFCRAFKKHFKQTPGEYRKAEAVTLSPNE